MRSTKPWALLCAAALKNDHSPVQELHQLSLRLTALLRRYRAVETGHARLQKTVDRQAVLITELRRRVQTAEATAGAREAGTALRKTPSAQDARRQLDAVIAQIDTVLAGLQD